MLNRLKKLDNPSRTLVGAILLTAVSVFATTPLFLVFILLCPGIFIFKLSRKNILESIPLLLMLNAGVFITLAILAELVGLKVNVTNLALLNLLVSVISFFAVRRNYLPQLNIEVKDRKILYAIYGLFLLAIASRVVSTRTVFAPILHDPISHAFWAKEIITTQTINYFYPPGLHILIGFVADSLGLNFAITTHYITNLLSAFTVLSWGVTALIITKDRAFALLLAALIFISPYPTDLYFTAGKNSFLVALAFMPLALYGLYKFIKKPNPLSALIITIGILSVLFLHYAVFGYLAALIVSACGLVLISRLKDKKALKPYFMYGIMVVLVSGILAGAWLVSTKNSYDERTENRTVTTKSVQVKTPMTTKEAFKQTVREFKATAEQHNLAYFPVIIISLLLILLIYTKSIYLMIPIFAACVFAIPFLINLLGLKEVGILRSTGMMMLLPIGALSVATVGACLSDKFKFNKLQVILVLVLIITAVGYNAYDTYKEYRKTSKNLSVIDSDDLAAFKWIDENIDDKQIFLNNAIQSPTRKKIIFGTDAGVWLPVYTGNDISMPFHEERFSSVWTHQNYGFYTALINDPVKNLCSLTKNGVGYYYQDNKSPYGPPINISSVIRPENLQAIHTNGSVTVFRLTVSADQCTN